MTTIAEFLASEQERLRALPYVEVPEPYLTEYHGGLVVLEECAKDAEPRRENKERWSRAAGGRTEVEEIACPYCGLLWKEDDLIDGKMPLHAKSLDARRQAERLMEEICGLVGFDRWSDTVLHASLGARDSRSETLQGRMAAGLPHLLAGLIRFDAAAGLQESLRDLLDFQGESDDHPFFTESTLYDLVGKDEARSILSCTRTLAKAAGYQGNTG